MLFAVRSLCPSVLPRLYCGCGCGCDCDCDLYPSFCQETLTEMQPQLAQAAVDTESLIKKVTADQLAADEQQAIVEKDVEEANKVAANVQVIKDDCQKVRRKIEWSSQRVFVCARWTIPTFSRHTGFAFWVVTGRPTAPHSRPGFSRPFGTISTPLQYDANSVVYVLRLDPPPPDRDKRSAHDFYHPLTPMRSRQPFVTQNPYFFFKVPASIGCLAEKYVGPRKQKPSLTLTYPPTPLPDFYTLPPAFAEENTPA